MWCTSMHICWNLIARADSWVMLMLACAVCCGVCNYPSSALWTHADSMTSASAGCCGRHFLILWLGWMRWRTAGVLVCATTCPTWLWMSSPIQVSSDASVHSLCSQMLMADKWDVLSCTSNTLLWFSCVQNVAGDSLSVLCLMGAKSHSSNLIRRGVCERVSSSIKQTGLPIDWFVTAKPIRMSVLCARACAYLTSPVLHYHALVPFQWRF